MKVYNSNHGASKKNTGVWYAVLAVLAVCVIGAIVAITIAVGGRDNASLPAGGDNVQPSTTKPTEYVLPFEDYVVAREAALDKLVYMPSVNMWKTHDGVDFVSGGSDDVRVMADGTVKSVQQSSLDGWVVTVDHGDGLVSCYKSLESATVKEGDKVKSGDAIGKAGIMITESDVGKHVHVEITKNGKLVDPLDYLNTNASK